MSEARYTETAIHFEVPELPRLLREFLPAGPLAYADFGCGDGPLFAALQRNGGLCPARPVCAIDRASRADQDSPSSA